MAGLLNSIWRQGIYSRPGSPFASGNRSSYRLPVILVSLVAIVLVFALVPLHHSRSSRPITTTLTPSIPAKTLSESFQQHLESVCGKESLKDGKLVLVTGAAGFIGFHTSLELHNRGSAVVGLDNFNTYYPVSLKRARQEALLKNGIHIAEGDLNDTPLLLDLFKRCPFTHVIHLAAQAGVRYAARNPQSYVQSNIAGTVSLLEVVKSQEVRPRVIYASSSSVYGLNEKTPFSEEDRVDRPASLYAATKRSAEMIAHVYHRLYSISVTGLRFFTVYGPWGRPDMSYFAFTRSILEAKTIRIFQGPNKEELARDFTYIDDIVAGIIGALETTPASTKEEAWWRVFNLGNTHPVTVTKFVNVLAEKLGKSPTLVYSPLPALGEVLFTHANISAAQAAFQYTPKTDLADGLGVFVEWYLKYYGADGSNKAVDELNYKPD